MIKNFFWDVIGKFGAQLVTFLVSIFLARILSPSEFGVLGMGLVIINISSIFLEFGFYRALVQQKNVTDVQYSTVFYINLMASFVLAFLCFIMADVIANFYEQPHVKEVFQYLSLLFILNGIGLVPASILYRNMKFKKISFINLSGAIISGVVGIAMALNGYGILSLIFQVLVNACVLLILNFLFTRWLPSFLFSISSITPLWKYGNKLFLSGFLEGVFSRLDVFLIGKLFNASTLGHYTRAQSFDNMVKTFSSGTITTVLFPFISKHQDNREYLKEIYIKLLHVILFLSIAISGFLFLNAKEIFIELFTEKWAFSAELYQLMAIVGFAWPVSSLMCNIIAGVGNSAAFLKLEILKKLVFIPVYVFGFMFGIKGFLICLIIATFVGVYLNALFTAREIFLSTFQQYKVIFQYLFLGICSIIIASFISNTIPYFNNIVLILIRALLYLFLFIGLIHVFKLKGFQLLFTSIITSKIFTLKFVK